MNIAWYPLVLFATCAVGGLAHAQDHAGHAVQADDPGGVRAPGRSAAMEHAAMGQADMDPARIGHAGMDHAGAERGGPDAGATTRAPSGHVAPPPPAAAMHAMAARDMVEIMGMDDSASRAMVAFDRFEQVEGGAFGWSGRIDYGGDADRLRLRSEGEHVDGRIGHADIELLWSHAAAAWWDTQVGVRRDVGVGPDRTWLAFGMQGLAPYWFEVGVTAYVGEQGRTALRAEVEYELLLTQRLVLQPRVELNAYGRRDPALGIGAGLSDVEAGLRLRYEIRREFAPYIGIERHWRSGGTGDAAHADGEAVADTQWVAGVRFWF